ncbi:MULTISPECIES: NADH-quinone oxidoreductase subunit NuoF [unclassified Candidatus Frackibacter]|uniref:NADH-quinone oxidoreductase subunit NuoF n=1 Tax=unclassified Candidatus Frackibacter TaxID=2648818 RepID=UPI00079B7D60|nr:MULTISPECIES: NADH-quinone oxidoreductase subunit NuoF [unclassified Candidatus Frackibacter]KXS40647.1 MAG: NAD(P)-dependent iron-only hydrogenase diaphorase component flavoprotein [Candidatus Frackibacter sp. T328-2]SDC17368.1 NADP-reducing hydrogenase subunit HndC [Candidatus Frackibacter sp. WG11]SFL47028.1 NADP-reducing hydrogenase subunit HndC [Candidatus Frackibacter sp. WG13]
MAPKAEILVCGGTSCYSSGGPDIYKNLIEELKRKELEEKVKLTQTGCFGFCEKGPVVVIYCEKEPNGIFYCQVKPEDSERILKEHIINGEIIDDLLYEDPETGAKIPGHEDMGFYKYQQRIALKNCGLIQPYKIKEYIARDGYRALGEALSHMTSKEVIEIVKTSKIRGRGGGGFPTGLKWELTAKAKGSPKYVICNADEGDPGAFMDRSILEGDPHSVIEGLAIAAYAIGAEQGYVYVRAEYPLAVERLEQAIKDARELNLLGEDIFETGFKFDLEIRVGAGAFVCGEETALMQSVQGERGDPRFKPPYPANKGLWGQPTVINNVETLANIPGIILNGGEWFSHIGTEESTGTKVFALAGDIHNTGLIEVPMGTTLREVVFELGGGIPNKKEFKAAQTGGPSGGCIPKEHLDILMDYDSLIEVGSMMGSGGLIIMDEDTCMVDVARFYLDFTQDEACGKCTPGRVGTKRLLEMLNKIVEGEAEPNILEKLEALSNQVKKSSLCGLGQSAPNPILSTLQYFRDEYEAHVFEKRCPAGVCEALLDYVIDEEKCKACGLCAEKCPAATIEGDKEEGYTINSEACKSCGICEEECPFEAITKG